MCCSNRLIHAVETSGNFKHSLCGRIRLVIPDAIVRRLCRFAVIVDSLIAVDVNGHNDLCHRIFRILSVIALRLLIIVGIVRGEHVDVNPNGSIWAIEGITSPDGRVLGKMGHAERIGDGLYRNVDGCYDMKLFQSAKKYFDI